MADQVDIRASDNADWTGAFRLSVDQAPLDLTGATFAMDIRATAAGEKLATLSTANERIAIAAEPATGVIYVRLPAGTLAPGRYVHDLLMTLGGPPELVWSGGIAVRAGVTR